MAVKGCTCSDTYFCENCFIARSIFGLCPYTPDQVHETHNWRRLRDLELEQTDSPKWSFVALLQHGITDDEIIIKTGQKTSPSMNGDSHWAKFEDQVLEFQGESDYGLIGLDKIIKQIDPAWTIIDFGPSV